MSRTKKTHIREGGGPLCSAFYDTSDSRYASEVEATCKNCLGVLEARRNPKRGRIKTHVMSPGALKYQGSAYARCGQFAAQIVERGEEPTCNACRKILGLDRVPTPQEQRIEDLEFRIKALEERLEAQTSPTAPGDYLVMEGHEPLLGRVYAADSGALVLREIGMDGRWKDGFDADEPYPNINQELAEDGYTFPVSDYSGPWARLPNGTFNGTKG